MVINNISSREYKEKYSLNFFASLNDYEENFPLVNNNPTSSNTRSTINDINKILIKNRFIYIARQKSNLP